MSFITLPAELGTYDEINNSIPAVVPQPCYLSVVDLLHVYLSTCVNNLCVCGYSFVCMQSK